MNLPSQRVRSGGGRLGQGRKGTWGFPTFLDSDLVIVDEAVADARERERERERSGFGTMEVNRSLEIMWDEKARRVETEDKEAFLQYQLRDILLAALCEDGEQEKVKKLPAVAMDMVHTYVPRSKRGLGLAARLCDAAFTQAHRHSMLLVPTCSYISIVTSGSSITTTLGQAVVLQVHTADRAVDSSAEGMRGTRWSGPCLACIRSSRKMT